MKKILDFLNGVVYLIRRNIRGIAQLVERRSPKPNVVSSNLTAPATQDKGAGKRLFFIINQ